MQALTPQQAEAARIAYHAKKAALEATNTELDIQRQKQKEFWAQKRANLHKGITQHDTACCDCGATIPAETTAYYHTEPLNLSNRGYNPRWTKLYSCPACAARRMEDAKA